MAVSRVAIQAAVAALTGGRIIYPDADGLLTGSANLFWDATNNRLGIGTTVPTNIVSIDANESNLDYYTTQALRIAPTFTGTAEGLAIWSNNNGSAVVSNAFDSTGAVLKFNMRTSNSANAFTAMTILGSGYVGIGTTNPSYPLHVVGNAYFSADVSALTFTDRTPFFEGDAVAELKAIKSINGEIDHATLPEFVKVDRDGISERDLGAMISMLTVAVQQLTARIEKLENPV